MILYKKQSLFDAPQGSILVHACNAQGVWGSGIAKEFKTRFPEAFDKYYNVCKQYENKDRILGRGYLFFDYNKEDVSFFNIVGCLITSEDYGPRKDTPEAIKVNTILALLDLLDRAVGISMKPDITIYSNKFNSGLFNVPWNETEFILKTVLKRYPFVTWIVCDPEHVG